MVLLHNPSSEPKTYGDCKMCGRYAFFHPPHRLVDLLNIDISSNLEPRYNAAPMQSLPIIVHHKLGFARWGFVPSWAKEDNTQMAAKMINARSETVSDKPAFRDSWKARHRCLVPATGFYEWKKINEDDAKPTPHYIHNKDKDTPLFFAGMWSKIGDLVTFTVLTKQAEGPIAKLHHRMPVLIEPNKQDLWFKGTERDVRHCIQSAGSDMLEFYQVSNDIGNVKNDTPELVKALAA